MEKEYVQNGNMANNMEELKELGKQMEQMKDTQQGDTRKSEPQQFDEDE